MQKNFVVEFLSFIRFNMGCNYLTKKVKQWFDESGGNLNAEFSFRFRGKESFAFLKHFPELIFKILNLLSSETSIIRLHQIFYQFTQLRKVVSFSVRVNDFDAKILEEMKSSCKQLLKLAVILKIPFRQVSGHCVLLPLTTLKLH